MKKRETHTVVFFKLWIYAVSIRFNKPIVLVRLYVVCIIPVLSYIRSNLSALEILPYICEFSRYQTVSVFAKVKKFTNSIISTSAVLYRVFKLFAMINVAKL